jgi:hypothetical protein
MFQKIAEFEPMASSDVQLYVPRVYGDRAVDGVWEAWVVFFPVLGGSVISTPRETTQTSYEALQHWAQTLDRVYLEGALERALDTNTSVPISSADDVSQAEANAAAAVVALHRAADRAGIKAASETVKAETHERAAAVARTNSAEFAREQEEMEALADEAVHDAAEAAAARHESAAREARAIAAETRPAKPKRRARSGRRKPK